MHSLRELFDMVGGMEAAALACGVSVRALYKWANRNSLPRTEYTGETRYAEALAGLCRDVTADEIRRRFSPSGIAA